MFRQQRPGKGDSNNDTRYSSPTRAPFTGNGPPGLRTPPMDDAAYIYIFLVVLIPVTFTLILCTITYCVYRYNKRRSERAPTNSIIVPNDRSGAQTATIIYNTQHSPFIFEESPPSYDSLADIKKDPHGKTAISTEQIQLTNMNQGVTSTTATLPTAPTPPFYINLNESNK